MKKVLLGILFATFLIAWGIWYAAMPALKEDKFPAQRVVQFSKQPPSSPADAPQEIKVVTYNIGFASGAKNNLGDPLGKEEVERNLLAIAEALKSQEADIVGLQEVDFFAARSHDINQFEFLAKALEMPYGAYVVTWNKKYLPWPYWPPWHQYGKIVSGQAVLSRFPIQSQELKVLPKPKENYFWYNWFYLDRVLQKLTISLGPQSLHFWHVHLEAYHLGTRMEQTRILAGEVMADRALWKIALGDFNSVSSIRPDLSDAQRKDLEDQGQPLKLFAEETGMKDAVGEIPYYTFPSWDAYKRIDHIFYSPSLQLKAVGNIQGVTASDHLPFWAEFDL